MSVQQFVIFNLGHQSYGLEISAVDRIVSLQEIYKVPNMPRYVEGLMNLDGSVFTIFNLKKRLSMSESEASGRAKVIIATVNSCSVGLIVDEVKEIAEFDDTEQPDNTESACEIDPVFIRSTALKNEKSVTILNLPEVVNMKH